MSISGTVASALFSLMFYLIETVVMIVICYMIAKKAGLGKGYAFLGLLGFVGIIILVVLSSRANMNNAHQRINFTQNNNYNPNNFAQNNEQYNPYQNANNSDDMQYTTNYSQTTYDNQNYDDITYGSSNYDESQLNICHTHDGHNETYDSAYDNYEDVSSGSYNLNGEVVKKEKNVCPHCGAKHGIFATHCVECGARL